MKQYAITFVLTFENGSPTSPEAIRSVLAHPGENALANCAFNMGEIEGHVYSVDFDKIEEL